MSDNKINIPSPDLIYVIQAQVHDIVDDVHTSIPARVVSYDHVHQTINAQTLVWDWDHEEFPNRDVASPVGADNSDRVGIRPPTFVNVPLALPAGGGFRHTFPMEAGDQVLLVFSERSLREWKINGGEGMPKSETRHALGGAIAIPCVRSPNKPFKGNGDGVSATAMTMGYDTGPQYQATKTQLHLGHAGAADGVVRKSDLQVIVTALTAAIATMTTALDPAVSALSTFKSALNTLGFPTASSTVFAD